jgi:hypothetical protein
MNFAIGQNVVSSLNHPTNQALFIPPPVSFFELLPRL